MNDKIAAKIRIGTGAGFAGDRIDPAVALVERGGLDYIVFECLAERTIALAVRARMENPDAGYDPLLEERMRAVLPAAVRNGVRVITNMGAANPLSAARKTAEIARELGLRNLKIAAISGDDVLAQVRAADSPLIDVAGTVGSWPGELISANAYLGCEPIVEALKGGADIVLTGRVADPSLFLAPMVHEFGWSLSDWKTMGHGTIIGHLMECAGQVTGGYFADPGFKDVSGLANLGFPVVEISKDGAAVITKLADTGGAVTLATCKEQLLYELHDPARYLTPDVTADFTSVRLEQAGPDRVAVYGGGGSVRPEKLKVSVGYHEGYTGEGEISYAGPGAMERGRLALEIVQERLKPLNNELIDLRFDLVGVDSIRPGAAVQSSAVPEVRVRVAGRSRALGAATRIGREVEALYTNGPAAGGGAWKQVTPVIAIASTLIDRNAVVPTITWETVA